MAGGPCPNCSNQTVEGARFCANCGASLDAACPVCGTPAISGARFCSHCGSALSENKADEPGPAERRQMAVLFCDLAGSTELSQRLDAEDLREVLRSYHQAGAAAITRYEGYVAKFLGDGIMAFFGYPVAHEDDSKRSILAGLAIVEAALELNPAFKQRYGIEISVRVGIHTGLVVAGEMGTPDRPVMDIVGETPNVAARLQEHAPLNGVVISGVTHRLVELDFDFESLGPKAMKGVAQPVDVFRVLAASEGREQPLRERQMVGRDAELRLLQEAWTAAKSGKGRCVFLSGEPGIGKSTLVNAMLDQIESEPDSAAICLRCSPYHQNTPFFPVIEYLRTAQMGIHRHDTAEEQLEKLLDFTADRGFPPEDVVPIVAPMLSIPYEHRFAAPVLAAEGLRLKTLELLVQMAVRRAERQSVLLVLDNVHWADPSTIELFQRVLERLGGIRMLAIATYRPHFQPNWAEPEGSMRIRLERLELSETQALVRQAAGGKAMPPEILEHILAKTDGVPLFVEELTKAIIESGVVRERPEGYELAGAVEGLSIPSTLHGSLVARLERVPGLKEVAQVAAVVGREFTPEVVAAVSHRDEVAIGQELENLVSAELIYPVVAFSGGKAYRFRHALIQDAAYDSLLKSARQQYHSEIAQTIETRFAETAEEQPEMVATHYSAAGMADAAIQWWSRAGQKALSRSANAEAIAHFTKGLELLEQASDSPAKVQNELGMLVQRGTALIATKGFAAPEVGETFRRAEMICELIGETPLLFPVIWGLWVYHLVRSDLDIAIAYSEQMLRLAEISQESGMFLEGHFTMGNALFWQGRLEEARDHLKHAQDLYDPALHKSHTLLFGQDPGVSTLCYTCYTQMCLGLSDQAYESAARAYELALEIKHPFSIGWALAFGCSVRSWNRDYEAAKEMADRCRAFCAEQGQAFWLSASIAIGGMTRYYLGEREEGIRLLREGLVGYEMTGSIVVTPLWRGLLAETLVDAGELEEALTIVETGLAAVSQYGEELSENLLRRVKGDALRKLGKSDLAEDEYRRSYDQAMAQHCLLRALQTAISWVYLERSPENLTRLQATCDLFTEGLGRADLEEARRLLES